MTLVCLWAPRWPTAAEGDGAGAAGRGATGGGPRPALPNESARLAAGLLRVAPHLAWGAGGVARLDARGLDARLVARAACAVAAEHGAAGARAATGAVLVAAEVAARHVDAPLTVVPSGRERHFLAPFPVGVLEPAPRLAAALADLGLATCGELAALSRESIETRLGAAAAALWRLARGDDPRLVFAPAPRALPSASVAWEEYALRDPERLLFPANALLGAVCAALRERGEAARQMTLTLTLASREVVARPLRAARASADQAGWLRLVRHELERFTLGDGVVGLALRAEAAGAAGAPQGDLFDRGFQSGEAAEAALARLIDDGDAVLVGLSTGAHPLLERRTRWEPRDVAAVLRDAGAGPGPAAAGAPVAPARPLLASGPAPARGAPPEAQVRLHLAPPRHRSTAERTRTTPSVAAPPASCLSLQLLPAPRPVRVVTTVRRGLRVPARYDDGGDRAGPGPAERAADLVAAAGPDLVAGGREAGEPYAREYFQCLTSEGALVLLFRDMRGGAWYLHGWWD